MLTKTQLRDSIWNIKQRNNNTKELNSSKKITKGVFYETQ